MAIPHPEHELARVDKLVAAGLPPIAVVTGTDEYFRTEAMNRLVAAVPKDAELRIVETGQERGGGGGGDADDEDGGDADGDVVDDTSGAARTAGTLDVAAAIAACPELADLRGGGLFARSAFVVVRRGAAWWQRNVVALAAISGRIGKGCGLLLEAGKLDKRKKAAQTLVKSLGAAGALFEFRELYETPFGRDDPLAGELCKWVVTRAAQLGVALQPQAAWLLVMQVGKAPAELLAELQRLRDRFGADTKRPPLAPAELRGKLTVSFASTPFDLANAVLAGDEPAAVRAVRGMFERGARGKDGKAMDAAGLFPWTTSWLYQEFARVLEGRQLLASGVSLRDLPARAGVHAFTERFVAQVQRNDAARLRHGLQALHACQRASRLTGEDPDVLLERFLAMWFRGAPVPTAAEFEL